MFNVLSVTYSDGRYHRVVRKIAIHTVDASLCIAMCLTGAILDFLLAETTGFFMFETKMIRGSKF